MLMNSISISNSHLLLAIHETNDLSNVDNINKEI